MNDLDSHSEQGDALRLRCVRQITDADDETLTIASAVLNRAVHPPTRTPPASSDAAPDAEAGAK